MFILTMLIVLGAVGGICCAFTNTTELESSNIILGSLSALVLLFSIFNFLSESNTSIINTYCTKNYSNNVANYNKCKYGHKGNFSEVIMKGIK